MVPAVFANLIERVIKEQDKQSAIAKKKFVVSGSAFKVKKCAPPKVVPPRTKADTKSEVDIVSVHSDDEEVKEVGSASAHARKES